MQWNLEGPEMSESALSLDMLRYCISYFLAPPDSFFHQKVKLVASYLKTIRF